MGSASIYSFPDKAILGVTSGISHRLECTGMRAVIFRYPPHTRTFLSAHFWLRHRRQAETWITPQYGRRTSFKSDSIGRDSQYEESNVRAIFPTHNPTHNSRSLVGLTSILAVPSCCYRSVPTLLAPLHSSSGTSHRSCGAAGCNLSDPRSPAGGPGHAGN